MSNKKYVILWLGYNIRPNYDSIWGIMKTYDEKTYTFWGKRGKKILFKRHDGTYMLNYLKNARQNKGFVQIHPEQYNNIHCPGFFDDFESWFVAASLADDFR